MRVLNLATYQFDEADNNGAYVELMNAQYRLHRATVLQPMDFFGRCRRTDLPSFHPYWRIMSDFAQIRRIMDLRLQIASMREGANITDDADKHCRMSEMITNLQRSHDGCLLIWKKYRLQTKTRAEVVS